MDFSKNLFIIRARANICLNNDFVARVAPATVFYAVKIQSCLVDGSRRKMKKVFKFELGEEVKAKRNFFVVSFVRKCFSKHRNEDK